MRVAEVSRETKETSIKIRFDPDTRGEITILTGVPFMDHMLESFSRHGGFSLTIEAKGDLAIDPHHTIEDIGIVMGQVMKKSLGECRGIRRFAHAIIPMDESRATVALDIGGRGYLVMDGSFTGLSTGGVPNDLVEHFFYSLSINAGITSHIIFSGVNDHHKCEAIFKAFGVALGSAMEVVAGRENEILSTKGVL